MSPKGVGWEAVSPPSSSVARLSRTGGAEVPSIMLLILLLACPGPTPVPPPTPNPPSEWVDITKPPGSADGVRCWAWKGVDPVCQWPSGGPVPPPPVPPVPPEPPKAEPAPAETKP